MISLTLPITTSVWDNFQYDGWASLSHASSTITQLTSTGHSHQALRMKTNITSGITAISSCEVGSCSGNGIGFSDSVSENPGTIGKFIDLSKISSISQIHETGMISTFMSKTAVENLPLSHIWSNWFPRILYFIDIPLERDPVNSISFPNFWITSRIEFMVAIQ